MEKAFIIQLVFNLFIALTSLWLSIKWSSANIINNIFKTLTFILFVTGSYLVLKQFSIL